MAPKQNNFELKIHMLFNSQKKIISVHGNEEKKRNTLFASVIGYSVAQVFACVNQFERVPAQECAIAQASRQGLLKAIIKHNQWTLYMSGNNIINYKVY